VILTAHVGLNEDLISEVAKLYLKPGMKVADVTYGAGRFWKKATPNDLGIELFASDLIPEEEFVEKYDFTKLPYGDKTFDVVVFDPPYMHGQGTGKGVKESISKVYKSNESGSSSWSHKKTLQLYAAGMREAARIVKPGGMIFVKCQDEIESGKQQWTHVELLEIAASLGLKTHDLFVLVFPGKPALRQAKQLHARKNHSYLLALRG
jgi:ubiquinone/menaquinone biosynthesis C-methylase UbiE